VTALATSDDVEAVLGRTLTAEESAKVGAALDKASALVRAETGRFFEADTYTVRRKVRDRKVASLDDPTSVSEVVAVDGDGNETAVTGYTLRNGVLYGLGCDRWVEITYVSAGDVPSEIVTEVAALAAANITASAPEGAESYTVTRGPFSESASFAEATDSLAPTPSSLAVIRKYALRLTGPVSQL